MAKTGSNEPSTTKILYSLTLFKTHMYQNELTTYTLDFLS